MGTPQATEETGRSVGAGGRPTRWRRGRRWLGGLLLLALALLILLGGLSLASGLSLRRQMLAGEAALRRGRAELLSNELSAAAVSFGAARERFGDAVAIVRRPWIRALGWLPFLGRTSDALSALVEAGARSAEGGEEVARAAADLPGGLAALGPRRGKLPVERYSQLAGVVARAERLAAEALGTVRRAPTSLLPGPVAEARRQAQEELEDLHRALRVGAGLLRELPAFLGGNGSRRYFVGAENPAELRGTGGLIGAHAILTVRGGRLSLTEFRPIQQLPLLDPREVPGPTEDYVRNYDGFRDADGYWANANMTPDFPSAARAILDGYEAATGTRLDGVITTDPFTLEALVRATGPVVVPTLGVRLDADEVVPFVAVEARALFPDSRTRKLVLGNVAGAVLERFLMQGSATVGTLRALASTAASGHLRVYDRDERMQDVLAGTAVAGAFAAPPGDMVAVVQNNAAASKLDFYQQTTVSYVVRLAEDGSATGTLRAVLENDSPEGERGRQVHPSLDNAALVHLYCATTCEPRSFQSDGEPLELRGGVELGHPYLRGFVEIPRGDRAQLEASLRIPDAWRGNSSGGTYRLTVLTQSTVRPTRVRVEIWLPKGMRAAFASGGLRPVGDRLVFEGTPGPRLELEASFAPSLPLRLWRDLLRFLSTPVFRL